MSKAWSGRFNKTTDSLTDDFNSSIHFDARLYKQDIQGSMAHVQMLGKQKILEDSEVTRILEGLKSILEDIESEKITFDIHMEDIHMNIEALLTERIGDIGKKLHTGRSRNDQVATDMRLYIKKVCTELIEMINGLGLGLLSLAKEHSDTVMPGYTHLQRAQPVTLAHHLLAYTEMLKRDVTRFKQVYQMSDTSPLGAGALATTTYPLDRYYTANLLGFSTICQNSLDAVSDRDFCIDFLEAAAVYMMHLSRFSEEIILWCSSEFHFITLDDAYATGSSIMPQKKNPDIAELVRGKTGRIYGHLMGLLTTMKGLPLAYNKDMQEDKEPVFDTVDTLMMVTRTFKQMVTTIAVHQDNMLEAAKGGFTNATDAADWLVKKGVPFRDAHAIIGKLVFYALEQQKDLNDLSLEEYQSIDPIFDETIYPAIDINNCVNARNIIGGPAKEATLRAIAINEKFFKTLV